MLRFTLQSSLLETAAYQDQAALLELEFCNGAVYQYSPVPRRTWEELLRADSKGAYFNSHIRNHFVYAQVRPARGDFLER